MHKLQNHKMYNHSSLYVHRMKLITSTLPITVILWILATSNLASGKRLLIITPAPSYSHQIVFRALCLALNKRGHEIVVLTPNTLNDPGLTNYTEIDFGFEYEKIDDTDLSQTRWNLTQLGGLKTRLLKLGHSIAEDVLSHPDLTKYYANGTNQQFDAVIAEMIMTPAIYMLAHKFNAPLIGNVDKINNHAKYYPRLYIREFMRAIWISSR